MGPPSERQWLTQLKESALENCTIIELLGAAYIPCRHSDNTAVWFSVFGVEDRRQGKQPSPLSCSYLHTQRHKPGCQPLRVLPVITFSISSCDYSCNIFTAEQLESEQSKSMLKGVFVLSSGKSCQGEWKWGGSVFASLLTSSSERCWLGYLPANCLIGELFHPIELLLHFRSLAGPSFRSNASKPGLWFVMKFTGPLPLVVFKFPPRLSLWQGKTSESHGAPQSQLKIVCSLASPRS